MTSAVRKAPNNVRAAAMASDEIGGCCDLNHTLGVLKGERDTWAAARAWQAFRDWLNGSVEQWQQYAEGMYAYGRQLGWEDV